MVTFSTNSCESFPIKAFARGASRTEKSFVDCENRLRRNENRARAVYRKMLRRGPGGSRRRAHIVQYGA
ncbi:hypothetical protein GALLR39Z86_20750 [Glycomyces algeriensis]|uniref:Uncharacterized protein n=1 Tax=Glycomyces algeriensis TaxID=256037 RepID=A0A9W6LGI2_9ACTN|nr:hypothetical protein GALLR39Z86_20750 [Glycomyces algeriensis]